MGRWIITTLLDLYCENPKLMHDRVLPRIRLYSGLDRVSSGISRYTKKPLPEREGSTVPRDVLRLLTWREKEGGPEQESNQELLIRRIVEHISGMTDRFIATEYNRLSQGGREVEQQDESYFW